jgi:hypothetical protein
MCGAPAPQASVRGRPQLVDEDKRLTPSRPRGRGGSSIGRGGGWRSAFAQVHDMTYMRRVSRVCTLCRNARTPHCTSFHEDVVQDGQAVHIRAVGLVTLSRTYRQIERRKRTTIR